MERPAWAPQGIDLTVPSVSRMHDFYLGGSHNFEVDREAGRRAIEAWPGLPKLIQANRAFMRRAIHYALAQGIGQFLDIGSGIPTFGSTHAIAQAADPGARVVYVDNDQVAVAHSRGVLEGNDKGAIVSADIRTPQDIVGTVLADRLLDLERPVALLLVSVLEFVEEKDAPWKTVAEISDALPPGSLLALTHSSTQQGPKRDGGAALREVYGQANSPLVMRSRREIERFFEGWELVSPGLVPLPHWRPDEETEAEDPVLLSGYAGVGHKSGSHG